MLNKLNYYRERFQKQVAIDQSEQTECGDDFITVLSSFLSQQGFDGKIVPIDGGTLGITFVASSESRAPIFIKTHLSGEKYRLALKKEYQLLKKIYDTVIYLQQVDIGNQTFLLEDKLYMPQTMITPENVLSIIRIYQKQLETLKGKLIKGCYSIEDILNEAERELPILFANGLLSAKVSDDIERSLDDVKTSVCELPRCICHGDFSDKNIMQTGEGTLVAIDWEDAFWGIAGYDYLYWLTFFGHRKYYNKVTFGKVNYDTKLIKGILMMILVIKSAISFYSGSYLSNSLTAEQRIIEILQILEGA